MTTDKYKVLSEIIELCLDLDKMALKTYSKFMTECKIPALAKEWKLRAEEEKRHMIFWRDALALSKKKLLPLIFEFPLEVKNKLKKIKKNFTRIYSSFTAYDNPAEELTLAFLLESHMLHPEFLEMFQAYNFIDNGISDDYSEHVISFTKMIKNHHTGLDSLRIEILNENLYDLYIANEKMLKTATHDNLTGLYNRHGFFSNIKQSLSLAVRNKLKVAVIMMDFDNFKNINDSHGHQVGDTALKGAASIIKSGLRDSCLAARYGGDEFIILCDIEDKKSLEVICERLRQNINKNSEQATGIHFTISIGAATGKITAQEEASLAKIIHDADSKLLETKKNGKNSWLI